MTDATRTQVRLNRAAQIAANARAAFADHAVTVELEQGLYRHYRCAKPGTGYYCFHVVTFPGRLVVCGDVGDMAWERSPDMLEWASSAIDSIGYFAEKCWGSLKTKEWSEDVAKVVVEEEYRQHVEDAEGTDAIIAAETAIRDDLLEAIDAGPHAFAEAYHDSDWYGGDFPCVEDYTADFLWTREAVKWFLAWHKARGQQATGGK